MTSWLSKGMPEQTSHLAHLSNCRLFWNPTNYFVGFQNNLQSDYCWRVSQLLLIGAKWDCNIPEANVNWYVGTKVFSPGGLLVSQCSHSHVSGTMYICIKYCCSNVKAILCAHRDVNMHLYFYILFQNICRYSKRLGFLDDMHMNSTVASGFNFILCSI